MGCFRFDLTFQGWNVSTLHDISMKLLTSLAVLSAQRLHTLSHIDVGSLVSTAGGSYSSVLRTSRLYDHAPSLLLPCLVVLHLALRGYSSIAIV